MKKLTAILLSLLLLAACAPAAEESVAGEEWQLWFAVRQDWNTLGWSREDASDLAPETRAWEREPTAEELLTSQLAGPISEDLYTPFPRGVEVRSVTVDESGTAWVDLSEQYGGLAGFGLTVADYCITLTLCQLPQVETVRILVEGEVIPYRNRQRLQQEDVLLTDISEEPETFLAVLYFPDSSGRLSVEYRQTERPSGSAAATVLTELLRGPFYGGTRLSLPEGTQLRAMWVNTGVCHVNLSREFLLNAPREEEQAALTLYALVDSLCALSEISQVQLLVEGEPVEFYGGVAANLPLSANLDLIQSGALSER